MHVERRKQTRLITPDNAFAALGRNYAKVGKIKNISRGGLSFEYIAGEQDGRISSQIDIYLTDKVFNLYNVPCRMVYDIEVHIPYVINHYVKLLTTKRCGVQFRRLDQDKLTRLNLLLRTATVGRIHPPDFRSGGSARHLFNRFPADKEDK